MRTSAHDVRPAGATVPDAAGGPGIAPGATVAWERLSDEIRTCRKCALHATRTQAVVYRGSLAPSIVFVGEAPGAAEDRAGIPFVGRSGRTLDAAIARLALAETEYGVLNVLKCRPPGNRFDREAAATCRPYLERQLALLSPRVLVTLGSPALHALDPGAPPMLAAAGRVRADRKIPLFPLIHPAAAMRSRRLAARWSADLARLADWLGSGSAQLV